MVVFLLRYVCLFLQESPSCCLYVQLHMPCVHRRQILYFSLMFIHILFFVLLARARLHDCLIYNRSASAHDLAEYHVENPSSLCEHKHCSVSKALYHSLSQYGRLNVGFWFRFFCADLWWQPPRGQIYHPEPRASLHEHFAVHILTCNATSFCDMTEV